MESVEGRAGDEGGLILDPQLSHRVEIVGKNDALPACQSMIGHSFCEDNSMCLSTLRDTYLVTHPHLEDGTVLLGPFCRDLGVLVP